MIKSDFIAYTDDNRCTNCGICEQRCNFGARKLVNGKLSFFNEYCFGCGMCVSECPEEAIILKKKPKNHGVV